MNITWIAHSCFKVTLKDGTVLLFDPFDDSIGYACPDVDADVVLVSHDHKDHNCLRHIRAGYQLVNAPGENLVGQVKISGYKTCCNKTQGVSDQGKNISYKVQADGMTLLHLGDIGHVPDDAFFAWAGKVDVLFVPVGGRVTVDALQAFEICKRIEPNVILPMHYKTLFLELNLDPVFNFTDVAGRYFDRSRLGASSFEITAETTKKRSRIIVMDSLLEELEM